MHPPFFSPEYMESYPLSALTLRDIGAISYEYITLITSNVSCHNTLLLKFLHETESVGLRKSKYFTTKFGQSHSASDYVKFKKKHFRLMMI